MNNIETLKQELLNQKTAIEEMGGSVTVANINPSPSEITEGISTINSYLNSAKALMGDKTKQIDNSIITNMSSFREYAFSCAENALQGQVTIGSGVTAIPNYCFNDTWLESYTLPSTVTSLGNYAFGNCERLTHATIPDSVTTLSQSVFTNTKNMTSIYIGTGITTLPTNTFKDALNVTSITIPSNITKIFPHNFYRINATQDFYVLGNETVLGSSSALATHGDNFKIWINFEALAYYRTATNWSQLYTYIISKKEMTAGEAFPTVSGVSLNWYASIADAQSNTNVLTAPSTSGLYYCKYSA